MKKYILIVAVVLSAIAAQAQAINKEYLPGRWSLYSVNFDGVYMCSDSIEETKKSFIEVNKTKKGDEKMSDAEMAQLDLVLPNMLIEMEESYVQFNKDGTAKAYFSMEKGEEADEKDDTERSYKWLSDNEIMLLRNGKDYTKLKVISLSRTHLVVTKLDGEGSGEPNKVVFRKR